MRVDGLEFVKILGKTDYCESCPKNVNCISGIDPPVEIYGVINSLIVLMDRKPPKFGEGEEYLSSLLSLSSVGRTVLSCMVRNYSIQNNRSYSFGPIDKYEKAFLRIIETAERHLENLEKLKGTRYRREQRSIPKKIKSLRKHVIRDLEKLKSNLDTVFNIEQII